MIAEISENNLYPIIGEVYDRKEKVNFYVTAATARVSNFGGRYIYASDLPRDRYDCSTKKDKADKVKHIKPKSLWISLTNPTFLPMYALLTNFYKSENWRYKLIPVEEEGAEKSNIMCTGVLEQALCEMFALTPYGEFSTQLQHQVYRTSHKKYELIPYPDGNIMLFPFEAIEAKNPF